MKNAIYYVLSALFFFTNCTLNAQFGKKGNGNIVKTERNVESFTGIDVGGSVHLTIKQGDQQKVEVETDENLQESIKTSIDGQTLKISTESRIRSTESIKVFLTVKDLKYIAASGATEIKSNGQIIAGNIEINLSGASEIKLDVKAIELKIDASGGADADIRGAVGYLFINSSGGSDINAHELTAAKAEANASGGSDIYINVQDELKAIASGGADIKYKGTANLIKAESSGGANITKE